MSAWTLGWIGWGVYFVLLEGFALYRDWKDTEKGPKRIRRTLSAHFRRWFRIDTHLGRTVWLVTFGVFAAWFTWHIATLPTPGVSQ